MHPNVLQHWSASFSVVSHSRLVNINITNQYDHSNKDDQGWNYYGSTGGRVVSIEDLVFIMVQVEVAMERVEMIGIRSGGPKVQVQAD